ncbi:MAG: hypothetical protein AAF513_16830 [Pseudomonadota bacterium]
MDEHDNDDIPHVESNEPTQDLWQDWRMLTEHIPAQDSQDSPGFVLGYN